MHCRTLPLLALLLLPHTAAAQGPRAEQLAWLSGCWEGTLSGGRSYEEAWLPPRAGTLFGLSRTVRDGRVTGHEFLRIVEGEGVLAYLAHPAGQEPARFEATSATDTLVVFTNPAHDFPQIIEYRRRGADSLLARVAGPGPAGERSIAFPLARVRCDGRAP